MATQLETLFPSCLQKISNLIRKKTTTSAILLVHTHLWYKGYRRRAKKALESID